MRRTLTAVAVTVAVVGLISSCANGSAGDASPRSAQSSSAGVRLDTGTFATTPRKPFGVGTTDTNLLSLESQRMAEFVTLPQQIDERLSVGPAGTGQRVGSNDLGTTDTVGGVKRLFDSDNDALTNAVSANNYLSGMFGGASTAEQNVESISLFLTHGVMRFLAPGDAAKAAPAIAAAYGSVPANFADPKAPPIRQTFPSLPDTAVFQTRKASGKSTWVAITAYRYYVVVDRIYGDNGTDVEGTFRRSLALQRPQLDRFPLTLPTKGGARIQQDQNKILLYTLANPDPESSLNDGVFGPHGIAFQFSDQVRLERRLAAAGVAHVASSGSTVFRAATPTEAASVQKLLVDNWTAVGAPVAGGNPGVPGSTCVSVRSGAVCFVTVGRYTGVVSDGERKRAEQAIAAQYKILLQADQAIPN